MVSGESRLAQYRPASDIPRTNARTKSDGHRQTRNSISRSEANIVGLETREKYTLT